MTDVLQVQPKTFQQYGDIAQNMATTVAAAGAVDQAASVAAAATVFGLIGQDFLASFAYAQANNFSSILQLANVFDNTSTAAHTAAAAYSKTEQHNAAGFTDAGSSTT
ncbi:type VII secretion target [Nocardia alni]|uniref:type VII secretion target n=1 Tax=Nocardia alni TaxID=2815723 RepID=UPI0027DF7784|nr:type VII secretion target [Nocardia alni]